MVTISQICSTEREIEEYFKTIKLIEDKKGKVKLLYKQKDKVENDIKNSNIQLKSDIQGLSYDKPNIQKSNAIVSFQERALDKAFELLEKRLESVKAEIIYIEDEIMELESKIYYIENIVKKCSEQDQDLLKLVYTKSRNNKKSYEEIGELLSMHGTTAMRQKEKLLKEITLWRSWHGDI